MPIAVGFNLNKITGTSAATAIDTYNQWVLDYNLTPVINTLDGDDGALPLNLVSYFTDGSNRIFWDKEGGIGFFKNTPANETSFLANGLVPDGWRAFSTTTLPDLLLKFGDKSASDRKTFNSKVAVSGGVGYIFADVSYLANSDTSRMAIAIKISENNVEAVLTNISGTNISFDSYLLQNETGTLSSKISGHFTNSISVNLSGIEYINANLYSGVILYKNIICKKLQNYHLEFQQYKKISIGKRMQSYSLSMNTSKLNMMPVDSLPYGFVHENTNSVWWPKGRGTIEGTVKIKQLPNNLPVEATITALRSDTLKLASAVTTDPITGIYKFKSLDPRFSYILLAKSIGLNYRLKTTDPLMPVPF